MRKLLVLFDNLQQLEDCALSDSTPTQVQIFQKLRLLDIINYDFEDLVGLLAINQC